MNLLSVELVFSLSFLFSRQLVRRAKHCELVDGKRGRRSTVAVVGEPGKARVLTADFRFLVAATASKFIIQDYGVPRSAARNK